ncbi:MAG: FMN-binding glutamate synthase family protein [Myxococcales bacterium]|nr:FMN-binding glutamate synthase family protein [Myxococcales bacterium]MCB9669907.1 FMN-binding glutamate synthase family protein [Alphaproteobacteria bacterium]MCB9693219.1 FMN-binding glutamate synthase family protein [Alphaproteobacteria bacterium]
MSFILANPGLATVFGVLLTLLFAVVVVGVRDVFLQRHHAIQHNFPVVGHLRYLFEAIGPELRQYWVANDKEERPFDRSERAWVYASAKGETNTFGFGTSEIIDRAGYPILKQAGFPFPSDAATVIGGDPSRIPCAKVIGAVHGRRKPYRPASIVNISAMSFGSLGARAVEALNRGAAAGHAYHNTGEGGVSPYHLSGGADVVWQLGTGYFGARGEDGRFSMDKLVERVTASPQIKMIEVKLSQGAKPGKGGILPAAKVTEEIAAIRHVSAGKDCYSPNYHAEFGTVDELIDFVESIADATGLPVGIKSAVGKLHFWRELAARMRERGQGPDYIVIDGGEGGTGAAPLTFSDHVSLPFRVGFARVYQTFQDARMADRVVWVGAGKLGFPDRAVIAFAMGCDLVYVAREAMLAIGCIQAQKCHTGYCPAGVATQNAWLEAGLDVPLKAKRMHRYLESFRHELLALTWAAGYEHPCQFTGQDVEMATGVETFSTLTEVLGYDKEPTPFTSFADLAD